MGETLDAAPDRHLRMLLARAQNPFDISDEVLERLSAAVLCRTDLHTVEDARPAPDGRCGRSRHTFLLADGGVQTLWELWYVAAAETGDGTAPRGPRFEIYEDEEALRRSALRLHGGGAVPGPRTSGADDLGHSDGLEGFEGLGGLDGLLPDEAARSRPWSLEDSPGHARRLLRRAENPDRPGEETLRLLADARGHDIVHVPRPRACPPGLRLWCSLYEHAFLLADGSEVRLYELEHNLTGGEGLVCEVYPDEAVAERAALRYARARGIEL
jgi:hypothetical protein